MKIFALVLVLLATGCAPVGFDFRQEGNDQLIHVADKSDAQFIAEPLRYRLIADEGHLVLFIGNPTEDAIELMDKSTVEDPTGTMHRLRGQVIEPHSAIKEVFPPLEEDESQEANVPPPVPQPGNPYDQPGFITVPGMGNDKPSSAWIWDDGLEIRLDLLFQQGQQPFEQHFVVTKVRK
jgi:hypothetical protein